MQIYLWALPKPVLSSDDVMVSPQIYVNPRQTWNTWSQDPVKGAILRAILACHVRLGRSILFGGQMGNALAQRRVVSRVSVISYALRPDVGSYLTRLSYYPDIWRAAISNVQDEN